MATEEPNPEEQYEYITLRLSGDTLAQWNEEFDRHNTATDTLAAMLAELRELRRRAPTEG